MCCLMGLTSTCFISLELEKETLIAFKIAPKHVVMKCELLKQKRVVQASTASQRVPSTTRDSVMYLPSLVPSPLFGCPEHDRSPQAILWTNSCHRGSPDRCAVASQQLLSHEGPFDALTLPFQPSPTLPFRLRHTASHTLTTPWLRWGSTHSQSTPLSVKPVILYINEPSGLVGLLLFLVLHLALAPPRSISHPVML